MYNCKYKKEKEKKTRTGTTEDTLKEDRVKEMDTLVKQTIKPKNSWNKTSRKVSKYLRYYKNTKSKNNRNRKGKKSRSTAQKTYSTKL